MDLISPYSVMADSDIKVMRISKMIAKDAFNSPCRYYKKLIQSSMESAHAGVSVLRVKAA